MRSLDHFWHTKYTEDEQGHAVRIPVVTGADEDQDGDDEHGEAIHMPSPSYYPALAAVGLVTLGYGLIYLNWGWIAVVGGVLIALWGFFGWSLEPVTKEGHH